MRTVKYALVDLALVAPPLQRLAADARAAPPPRRRLQAHPCPHRIIPDLTQHQPQHCSCPHGGDNLEAHENRGLLGIGSQKCLQGKTAHWDCTCQAFARAELALEPLVAADRDPAMRVRRVCRSVPSGPCRRAGFGRLLGHGSVLAASSFLHLRILLRAIIHVIHFLSALIPPVAAVTAKSE